MAEDKGSDLDVFEGLTKKKKQPSIPGPSSVAPASVPAAPETMRGGLGMTGPASRPLPSPKSVGGAALPKPKPPRKKGNSVPPASAGAVLPKPTPPRKKSGESESPALSVQPTSVSAVFEEPSGSVLPGHAVAELDWDDEEESTSVFDRSASDLFGDLAGKPKVVNDADDTSRRDVGKAAALLAMSGQAARAIPSAAPPSGLPVSSAAPMAPAPAPHVVPATPALSEPMPRIPAPAPVPRDISDGSMPMPTPAGDPRAPHPSWAPSTAPGTVAPVAPRSGASGATILLSLIAVLAAAAGVFFYLRSSSAAEVEIKVSHNGDPIEAATIYVDGREECKFAPCKLKLEPGSRSIRVTAGQLAGRQTVSIEGGGKVQITIPLGVAPDTAPPDSAEPEQPKTPPKLILASGMGSDVKIKVFVNDEDKGELPITLDALAAGDVKLRFEGGEKYGKVEKLVTLEPGKELKLEDIKLPLLEVTVKFELLTRGATVKLISEGDEKDLTFRANKAEMKLDTSKKWTVEAELKGYDTFSKTIDFDGAGEVLDFSIELQKEEEKPEPAPEPVSTGPGPTTPGPEPPGPDPTPVPANDFGFINANSRPPSKVLIDGKPMGGTPVMGHKVKPGSHSIVFKHPELGTRATSVTVAAGQTKTASVVFKSAAEPEPTTKKKKKKKKRKSDDE